MSKSFSENWSVKRLFSWLISESLFSRPKVFLEKHPAKTPFSWLIYGGVLWSKKYFQIFCEKLLIFAPLKPPYYEGTLRERKVFPKISLSKRLSHDSLMRGFCGIRKKLFNCGN